MEIHKDAIEFLKKAAKIFSNILEENHPKIASVYE